MGCLNDKNIIYWNTKSKLRYDNAHIVHSIMGKIFAMPE